MQEASEPSGSQEPVNWDEERELMREPWWPSAYSCEQCHTHLDKTNAKKTCTECKKRHLKTCSNCGKRGADSSIWQHEKECKGRAHLVEGLNTKLKADVRRCPGVILYVVTSSQPDQGLGDTYLNVMVRAHGGTDSPWGMLVVMANDRGNLVRAVASLRPSSPLLHYPLLPR